MIISILFGFLSIILALTSIFGKRLEEIKRLAYSFFSLAFTGIAILEQLAYANSKVKQKDWTALTDTTSTSFLAALVLFIIVLALNLIAMKNLKK